MESFRNGLSAGRTMISWGRRVLRALDRYWFAPGSYRVLAFVRVLVVGTYLLFFYPSLERQLLYAAAHPDMFLALPALKVLLLPLGEWGIRPDPTLIHAVWVVGIVAGVGALVGKYTRLSLIVLAITATILAAHAYSYGTVHHPRALTVIMLWTLAFSRCGRAWSLDDVQRRLDRSLWRNRFEPTKPGEYAGEFARWPLLLGQWVLALAYFSAGLSKLARGGLDWFSSSTLAYYLVQDGLRHDVPLGLYLAGYPELLTAIAVVVVLFELTFFLAVVIPRTAWIYLLLGAGMHLGVLVTQAAPFLQWAVLYVVFIPTLRRTFPVTHLRERLGPKLRTGRRWTVIYDGLCPLCIRSMVILDYLDIRRSLRPLDLETEWGRIEVVAPSLTRQRARHAMHLVTPDGDLLSGFHAFRALSRALPLLWPLLPVTHAPFADRVGTRIYAAVARKRGRIVPCRAAICAARAGGEAAPGFSSHQTTV